MKNENKPNGTASDTSHENKEQKADATKLPKMEMYAVLGLELSKQILEKLEHVEESIEILARQKKRELDEKQSDAEAN
jgi:hypothetical protein